jgi:hypothetical protein
MAVPVRRRPALVIGKRRVHAVRKCHPPTLGDAPIAEPMKDHLVEHDSLSGWLKVVIAPRVNECEANVLGNVTAVK